MQIILICMSRTLASARPHLRQIGGSRSLPVATSGYHFGCFLGRSSGRR
jgi:hypothetical protein